MLRILITSGSTKLPVEIQTATIINCGGKRLLKIYDHFEWTQDEVYIKEVNLKIQETEKKYKQVTLQENNTHYTTKQRRENVQILWK